jgi:hypothetical protein
MVPLSQMEGLVGRLMAFDRLAKGSLGRNDDADHEFTALP